MTAFMRRPPRATSFINRNPEGAALAAMLAGIALTSAMMPPSRAVVAARAVPAHAVAIPVSSPGAPVPSPAMSDPAAPSALGPDRAFAINVAMPISALPNPQAMPFSPGAGDAPSQARAIDCLTAAIYYEAAGEPDEGQAAVAQVVLNRVRDPAYPKSVCAVVFDGTDDHGGIAGTGGCQFTFTCDGAMARLPSAAGWQRARRAAAKALGGAVAPAVGWSTHYHTIWVAPVWAPTLLKTAVIGAHIFYRPPARAAAVHYAGIEPEIAQMASLSSVPMSVPTQATLAAAETPAAQPPAGALAMVLPGI